MPSHHYSNLKTFQVDSRERLLATGDLNGIGRSPQESPKGIQKRLKEERNFARIPFVKRLLGRIPFVGAFF